jgi:hypothetical protein
VTNPRGLLLGYQLLTGLSDAVTGVLLLFAPTLTMRLMGLHAAPDTLPFLSYIGAFVLSVGLACLYGAQLTRRKGSGQKLEAVWLLTAITRGLVALFIVWKISSDALELGWATVAFSDGALALLQTIGLDRGWLNRAAD